jgi:hypothetical protein
VRNMVRLVAGSEVTVLHKSHMKFDAYMALSVMTFFRIILFLFSIILYMVVNFV